MDLKSFSGSNFDPKDWINIAWNAAKEKEEKELFVTGAIGKLQLYMQQLNNAIEETSTQVSSAMPRILHDAASLQQEGLLLKDKLVALEGEVGSVETATGHSIQSLQRIDGLKGKLEVKWCHEVFGGKPMLESLLKLYSALLVNIKPSPTEVVTAGIRRSAAASRALDLLQDIKAAAKQFIEGINSLLDSDMGKKANMSDKVLEDLGLAVYAPLRQTLPRFGELQAQALAAQLEAVPCNQELAVDRARAAASAVELSGSWLSAAHSAAKKLAGVACYPHLINAIESFLSLHCSRLRAVRRQLESTIAASRSSAHAKEVIIDPTSLWESFAPALSMLASAGELLAITENLQNELLDGFKEDASDLRILHNMEILLMDPDLRSTLKKFRAEDAAPLSAAVVDIKRACRDLRVVALDVVFSPITVQLDRLPELPVWSDNDPHAADLPDYSFTPQEYITQIGQYLMTLPQHLEPFLVEKQRGPSLSKALTVGQQNSATTAQPDDDLAWYFLNQVCTSSCELYCDKILSIKHLDALGSRRCATDIAYLCSVVEDLGASGTALLRRLEKLIRASPSQYAEAAEGIPAKIVAAVRHLRALPPVAS